MDESRVCIADLGIDNKQVVKLHNRVEDGLTTGIRQLFGGCTCLSPSNKSSRCFRQWETAHNNMQPTSSYNHARKCFLIQMRPSWRYCAETETASPEVIHSFASWFFWNESAYSPCTDNKHCAFNHTRLVHVWKHARSTWECDSCADLYFHWRTKS